MTFPILNDQPPPEGQPPEGQPPVPDQAQGEPPPEEKTEEMRFFIRLQNSPDLPNYNQPAGLFRFQVTPDLIITDRFDRERDMWVDWPDMIGFTGIGGADDFFEVREQEANDLIGQWGGAEEADAGEGESTGVMEELLGDDVQDYQETQASPEEVQAMLDEIRREMGVEDEGEEPEVRTGDKDFQLYGSLRRLEVKKDDDEEDEEEKY